MPRLESAIERVVERMLAVYEREQAKYDEEYGSKPEELDAEYDQAIDMELSGQPGIQMFIAKNGQAVWNKIEDARLRQNRRQ